MSIPTQIERLETAKTDIAASIEGKGVTVPDGTKIDGMAGLLNNAAYVVNVSDDTVTADTLAVGVTAHDKAGNAITGVMDMTITTDTATTLNGLLKGNGSTVQAATAGTDYAAPSQAKTVTLATADWDGSEAPFTQTVNVTDMTDNANAVVSPAPASLIDYGAAQVRCITQGSGTLTFACETAPESDLTVNVLIVG